MLTSFYQVKDNAYAQLDASIGTGDLSLALVAGEGARFPTTGNDVILTLVNWDTSGTIPVVNKRERVVMTARSTDTLTVTRSYGGDSAQTFDAGDYVYLNVTQAVIEQIQDAVNTLESTAIIASGANSMDNNTALKMDNLAGTPVEVLKMTTGDVAEFQTLPRNPSSRSISNDYDILDKKYADDNFISVPTGALMIWATDSAPAGWVLCYGQAISRTTYANLFAVISTDYGVGDGSTTFNVPDLRGRFPLGQDDMGGSSANRVTHANADSLGGAEGEETHTLTVAELASHTHTITNTGDGLGSYGIMPNGANTNQGTINTGSAGSGDAHENMPPYITLNYIIKT